MLIGRLIDGARHSYRLAPVYLLDITNIPGLGFAATRS